MRTLKKMISGYMYKVTWVLVVCILIMLVYIQIRTEQRQAYDSAQRIFMQIESLLEENQQELAETQEEYRQTCLHNAETVARIIEGDPDVLNSVEELKEIAASVEIDEIHVFDTSGTIVTGTHPQYFGFTFDSGEQIMFFKPMLEDQTLKLVQEITPNTAEGKPMQYSAVWSESGEFIVQVGMEPVNVMKVTQKNELSYIFALFRVNPEASYYAINAESGEIVGSTNRESVGTDSAEIGLDLDSLQQYTHGFHTQVNGKISFCVFTKTGDNYIGRVIEAGSLYRNIPVTTFWILISLAIVVSFLVRAVVRYMNRYVVAEIDDVNEKLKSITDGNLEEHVDIQSSTEFAELSNYINSMVKSLLDNNRKMSYALSKTNIHIGTYEYSSHAVKVNYTEDIPMILSVDDHTMEQLASNPCAFEAFLQKIKKHPIPDEQGIYRWGEQYIRLEEIRNGDGIFGVAVDVTAETARRMEIEKERDIDILTGLYNRRGLERKLEQLFSEPEHLIYSAILMIDADGLKEINDTYGHEKGDIYLKKIAQAIAGAGAGNSVAARQGGDEFVLFLYGYDSEEALTNTIETLESMQSGGFAELDRDLKVPLQFSVGHCLVNGETDYQKLLKEADERMYRNKADRKMKRGFILHNSEESEVGAPDAEIWDLYSENRELLGKDHVRGEQLPQDTYHLVVHVWIRNSKGEYLISQRSANRPTYPLMWECVGGSVVKGEDSLQGAVREAKEEVGVDLSPENGKVLFSKTRKTVEGKIFNDILDVWLFTYDRAVNLGNATTDEVAQAAWMNRSQIEELFKAKRFVNTLEYFFTDVDKQ